MEQYDIYNYDRLIDRLTYFVLTTEGVFSFLFLEGSQGFSFLISEVLCYRNACSIVWYPKIHVPPPPYLTHSGLGYLFMENSTHLEESYQIVWGVEGMKEWTWTRKRGHVWRRHKILMVLSQDWEGVEGFAGLYSIP